MSSSVTHIGRLAEGVLHRSFVTEMPVIDDVAGGFGMQLRCARLDRGLDVGRRGKLFVVDDDGFRRVPGLVLGLGDHHRDRLSDEAHGLRRHRRPRAHFHRRAVLRGDRPAADQVADLVVDDLLSGQHRDHAGHLHCLGGVDALDLGMCMRAADEVSIAHADHLNVVDVTSLSGDEPAIFLAHDTCANSFNTHGLVLPTGDSICRRFHRDRR
ncbi:hypothetical protein ACVILK_005045 [Bradyrhizobium embrapense]